MYQYFCFVACLYRDILRLYFHTNHTQSKFFKLAKTKNNIQYLLPTKFLLLLE